MFVFNGLKGTDFFVYNYLVNADLSQRIPINDIVMDSCYTYPAIHAAIKRLESYGLIKRKDHQPGKNPGKPYRYEVNGK